MAPAPLERIAATESIRSTSQLREETDVRFIMTRALYPTV